MNTIQAVAKYNSREYDTDHGLRANSVFKIKNGEEERVWWTVGENGLKAIKKGQEVELLRTKKGFKIVQMNKRDTGGKKEKEQGRSSKDEIVKCIDKNIGLYRYIFDKIHEKFSDIHPDNDFIATRATMVFLQVKKEVRV